MVRGRANIQQAAAAEPPAQKPRKKFDHEYECSLKSVSIAKDKASVGLSIPRKAINVDDADEIFCGAQLEVMLEADPNASKKEPDGQTTLVESKIDFGGVATCGGFSVKSDQIGLTLQFVKSEVDLRQLGRFAALKGSVFCSRTGDFAAHEDE